MVKNNNVRFWSIYAVCFIVVLFLSLFIYRQNLKVKLPDRFVALTELSSDYPTEKFVHDKAENPIYVVDMNTQKIMYYDVDDYDDDNSLTMYTVYDTNGQIVTYSGSIPNN